MLTFLILLLLGVCVLILFGTMAILALMLVSTFMTRVPFVPITTETLEKAIRSYSKNPDTGVFYDLGSGDGRVVFAFARLYPNARATGFEIGPFPYLLSKCIGYFSRTANASIRYESFLHADLSGATHIFIYLFPFMVERLAKKFDTELKPGAEVISCDFPITSKEPRKTIEVVSKSRKHTLYLYEF